jgi:hypothetical protein
MFNDFKGFILLNILFFIAITSYSQGLGNSPYSRTGIGDLMYYKGTVRNMGMGYAGSSLMSKEYINYLNPAGIANFKGKYEDSLVKFDIGFTIQYKNFKFQDEHARSSGANVNNFALIFPASKVYTTGIVLVPLTIVQNDYGFQDTIANDPNHYSAKYNSTGSGGVYQFQWLNAIGISKNFSLGLTTSYNFGSILQEVSTQLISDPTKPDAENEVGAQVKSAYSGASFKPGFIFNSQLKKRIKFTHIEYDTVDFFINNHSISMLEERIVVDSTRRVLGPLNIKLGGSVEFFPGVKVTQTQSLFIRNAKNQLISDSTVTKASSKAHFPAIYRIGSSLEHSDRWKLAADFVYTDWSNFDQNQGKDPDLNASSYTFALGGEIMPRNFQKANKKLLYRPHRVTTYRAGLSYSATPVNVGGYDVYDYSFSLGMSLPVGVRRKESNVPYLPKLNVALVAGQRTTFTSANISENYFRIHLSMAIYENWFNKRRIQ